MFSKKPADRSPAGGPRPVASSATFSVLGADVVIKGNISATADLHVDGTVHGDIACASLVQGESSRVEGAIEAETARLAGHVKGTISVRDLVILRSARIEGDVHYDTLTIEQGAAVEGRFAPDAANKPQAQILELGKDDEQRLTLAG
jgi:cytoskeletal protein CcmA (bactofilin family)